jgi:hypothetical protein
MTLLWALLGLVAGLGSFGVSLYALFEGRVRNRRDLFLSLHEKLIASDLQRGRTLLREEVRNYPAAVALRNARDGRYQLVASAIAMFDVLGLYVHEGFVDKNLVFAEWGWLYAEVYESGQHVIQERFDNAGNGRKPWPHFARLGKEASQMYPVSWNNSSGA